MFFGAMSLGCTGEAIAGERRRAPWAGLDWRRRLAAVAAIPPHPRHCGVIAVIAFLAEPVRRCGGANPKADLDRPIAQQVLAAVLPCRFAAHQLQCTDDAGGARELVERQQAKRVAHEHCDPSAERPDW